jgi:iron complex outermembrane receptor protein
MHRYSVVLSFCLLMSSTFILAGQNPLKIRFTDAKTGQAIPFAAVTCMHPDSSGALTQVTDTAGEVLLPGGFDNCFIMKFDAIGYKRKIDGKFCPPFNSPILVPINPVGNKLKEITIESQRNLLKMDGEKKVFDVSSSIAAVTGSATQVLQQVPAVNVDMEGNISLRGNANVLVYIDGKPSGLTGANRQAVLEQIPAANIDKIEVITNPSARYEADGMAGIINIVLKNNKQKGYSLSVTPGLGTNNKYQSNINLGMKAGKTSVTLIYSLRQQAIWSQGYSTRDNFFPDTSFYFAQYVHARNLPVTHSGRASLDWNPNASDAFSIGINTSIQRQKQEEFFQYFTYSPRTIFLNQWSRQSVTYTNNITAEPTLNYKHMFSKKGHELAVSGSFSYNENLSKATYYDRNIENLPLANEQTLFNPINALFRIATTQADYVLPFAQSMKFESGIRINRRLLGNDFNLLLPGSVDEWNPIPGRSNQYRYDEWVSAAYAIVSKKNSSSSWQLGVRMEDTRMQIGQLTSDSLVDRHFTDWFPNLNANLAMDSNNDLQISFSRRLNRPNPQTLNPFSDYTDALNIRIGNPFLKPEYVHAAEISWLSRQKKMSWILTGYYRYLTNTIQRFREALPSGLSVVYFRNFSHSENAGMEGTLKSDPFHWMNLTFNANLFYMKLRGSNREGDLSNDIFSYSLKFLASIKLPFKTDLQITSVYNGPNALLQGRFGAVYGTDLGLRKDFLKGKLSLVANLSDVFDQRVMLIYTEAANFKSDNRRKRETRILMVSASYRLGQTENKKRQGRENQSEMNNDMGGW